VSIHPDDPRRSGAPGSSRAGSAARTPPAAPPDDDLWPVGPSGTSLGRPPGRPSPRADGRPSSRPQDGPDATGAIRRRDPDDPLPSRRSRREADTRRSRGAVQGVLAVIRETALVLAIALGLSLLIKSFLVQAFFIPSPSMEETLIEGDRVLVSKLTPGPFHLAHGDVVVFKDPDHWLGESAAAPVGESPLRKGFRETLTFVGLLPSDSGQHLIKRVIGLPGDHVVCCDPGGRLTVNGVALDEQYLYPGDQPSTKTFDITVPPEQLWVMGDHRSVSQDSRYHTPGTVPIDDVVGRAFVVVWPFDRWKFLHEPTDTFGQVPAAGSGAG
jgi:signal peptidase I